MLAHGDYLLLSVIRDLSVAVFCGVFVWWRTAGVERSLWNLQKQEATTGLALSRLGKSILAHDLTVVGLNDAVGEDLDERAVLAIKKYEELQRAFDEDRDIIAALLRDTASAG